MKGLVEYIAEHNKEVEEIKQEETKQEETKVEESTESSDEQE